MKKQKIILGAIGLVILGSIVGGCGSDDTSTSAKPKSVHKVEGDDGSLGGPTAKQTPAPKKTKKAPKPKVAKPVTFSDGDYTVGQDMPAGTYISKGAAPGMFAVCTVSSKPKSSNTMPIFKAVKPGAQMILQVSEADGTLTISGCKTFTQR